MLLNFRFKLIINKDFKSSAHNIDNVVGDLEPKVA